MLPATVLLSSLQISFFYQPVNMYRYKIRFDFPHFYDISCCPVLRIVGQKHQNIQCGLWQIQFMAQFFFFESFIFKLIIYKK